MSNKVHLTKALVDKLAIKNQRYSVADDALTGLQIRVSPSGSKTFYVKKKILGRTVSVRIGRFPDEVKNPVVARELALPKIAMMAQGINPNFEKKKERKQDDMQHLFDLFLNLHAKPNKKSWKSDEDLFTKHVPDTLKTKPLKHLTRLDIKGLHVSIGTKVGEVTANRVLGLINSIFNFAISELDMYDIHHPSAGMKRYKERPRKVRLLPNQVADFFGIVDGLYKDKKSTADALLLILFTGARSGNVFSMEWKELDLESGIWTLPPAKVKNNEELVVPLIEEAVAILKTIMPIKGNPYVFPSPMKPGTHLTKAAHGDAWRVARANTSFDGLTFHDLRRTHGSWMADIGISKDLLKAALGHKSDSSNDVYTHVSTEPVRKAKEATVAKILEFRNTG